MSDATACACGTCANCAAASGAPPTGPLDPAFWRHSAIRARLYDRIGRIAIDEDLPLAGLTTRASDDPAIALIDAFSGNLHVLAWNAARLADDATLLRSQDPQALTDLVGLTGYRPRPALSATTMLSFTLDNFPGSPAEADIPAGNRVASVPKPGNPLIGFETDADLIARPEWNLLTPYVAAVPPVIDQNTTSVQLAGVVFSGRVGDYAALAITQPAAGGPFWLVGQIVAITTFNTATPAYVRVDLGATFTVGGEASAPASDSALLIVFGTRTSAFGANAPDPLLLLKPTGATGDDPVVDAIDTKADPIEWKNLVMVPPIEKKKIDPDPGKKAGNLTAEEAEREEKAAADAASHTVDLDGSRPEAAPGRLLLFMAAGVTPEMARIVSSQEMNRKGFGLSSRATHVTFTGFSIDDTNFNDEVRQTSIVVETARAALLTTSPQVNLPDPSTLDQLVVQGNVSLPVGRQVLLVGQTLDPVTQQWAAGSELALVEACAADGSAPATTLLTFMKPLANTFSSADLTLLANVVSASQGESSPSGAELLGSSDATKLNPRFRLSRSPLTQLPAGTPQGFAPALEVRVGGKLYGQLDNLQGAPDDALAYMVGTARDGSPTIRFAGRLPTAANSVTALYRAGAGSAGNLDPGSITTMLAPVPGVRGATNPIPSDGGSDAADIDTIRVAAPAALATFDRVVSLGDYQSFAQSYRGVGKALASELSIGMRRIVVLTIASTSLLQPSDDVKQALATALAAYAPPGRPVQVQGFGAMAPWITVSYLRDPTLEADDVEAAIRTTLAAAFGASARDFAQGLPESAVLAAVQGVTGVIGANLTYFSLQRPGRRRGVIRRNPAKPGPPNSGEATDGRLLAPGPTATRDPSTGVVTYGLAGLLAVDPDLITFEELPA